MEPETYNALTRMLLWGALAALAASLGYFVAAIVGWRGPRRKRRLVHCVVLAALFPALVGVQQLLLYQVFLPSLGHKARQTVRQQHDEASFVNVGGARHASQTTDQPPGRPYWTCPV
jgi:hypothetical protein